MNESLMKKTEEWMQLERKTLAQRKVAEEFYYENLMSLIEADYIERNKSKLYEDIKYLIISVGTSYEPIVLNIKLFQPSRILFLYTEKTEKTLNQIVEYTKLAADCYEKRKVHEVEVLDIYREIKRSYLEWNQPQKMYIDFTGGTKAMSAAAAMAGALINIQMIYVGTADYLEDFRKPNPGSETLFYITNPLSVFGDLEIEKAFTLFKQYNYSGAQERLIFLKENIPDAEIRQQLNFVYLLARAYEAWDALDFRLAYEYMRQLNHELHRDRMHKNYFLMDSMGRLQKQEVILGFLCKIPLLIKDKKNMEILINKDIITALMFTMYQNALIREKQEKYDMSTLLFYRLIEMVAQRRLSHYNLNASQMDYEKIKVHTKRMTEWIPLDKQARVVLLKEKIMDIKQQLFGRPGNGYLPEQISLLDGFIILLAFNDPIVQDKSGNNMNYLKRMRSMVYLRNNSIFAHGLGPVSKDDFKKFKGFVEERFRLFCRVERIGFDTYRSDIEWVDPIESKNYSIRMGEH